jgi:prophage antirepressor-like protein
MFDKRYEKFNNCMIDIITFYDDNYQKIWFKGSDIAKILDYENTSLPVINNVDSENRKPMYKLKELIWAHFDIHYKLYFSSKFPDDLNKNNSNTIYIDEFGLYSLIIQSDKPKAKILQRWITSEVIPTIRKIGLYILPQNGLLIHTINKYDKLCLYIIRIRDNIYKFGISTNIIQKYIHCVQEFKSDIEIVKIYEMNTLEECDKMKSSIKILLVQLKMFVFFDIQNNKKYNNIPNPHPPIEFFETNFNILNIIHIIDNFYTKIKHYNHTI